MKLFLKAHLPWLLLEIVSIGLLILLIWLDGYRDLGILIYGVSLILCLTIVFLTIDYHKNQGFYGYLETGHMQKKVLVSSVVTYKDICMLNSSTCSSS